MFTNVKKVEDKILLKRVLVSCTDKSGLVSNENMPSNYPEKGILGVIAEKCPDVLFIATGKTYSLIKEAGLNVMEVCEYINFPEMETGMVKTLHPIIYAGILGNRNVAQDKEFLDMHGIQKIDAVIANFYNLYDRRNEDDFEDIRQAIDIGGPTMCHASRKSFLTTAVLSSPSVYMKFCEDLSKENGYTTLKMRFELAKITSKVLETLMKKVNDFYSSTNYEKLLESYELI